MFKHILCPVDGSAASLQALDLAARFAADQKARLTICTVVDAAKASAMAFGDPSMSYVAFEALDNEGASMLAGAAARVKDVITPEVVTIEGMAVDSILHYASTNGCDLIIMGSHGRSGIPRAFLGSVAEGVVRQADAPVMIIRAQRSGDESSVQT